VPRRRSRTDNNSHCRGLGRMNHLLGGTKRDIPERRPTQSPRPPWQQLSTCPRDIGPPHQGKQQSPPRHLIQGRWLVASQLASAAKSTPVTALTRLGLPTFPVMHCCPKSFYRTSSVKALFHSCPRKSKMFSGMVAAADTSVTRINIPS